jgi:hypothetical protein
MCLLVAYYVRLSPLAFAVGGGFDDIGPSTYMC